MKITIKIYFIYLLIFSFEEVYSQTHRNEICLAVNAGIFSMKSAAGSAPYGGDIMGLSLYYKRIIRIDSFGYVPGIVLNMRNSNMHHNGSYYESGDINSDFTQYYVYYNNCARLTNSDKFYVELGLNPGLLLKIDERNSLNSPYLMLENERKFDLLLHFQIGFIIYRRFQLSFNYDRGLMPVWNVSDGYHRLTVYNLNRGLSLSYRFSCGNK